MIYAKEKDYTLYQGKMQDVLDTLEENSIDSIVCDPPYELNFMGKGWDNQGIAFQTDTWKHCYRVLKDGGYLLAFGGSRTFHRIACAIEDAGFEIRDTIMWLYGSGFPKSMNIGLAIDKKNGFESKVIGYQKGTMPDFRDVGKKQKEISGIDKLTFGQIENSERKEQPIYEVQNEWQGWGTCLKPAYEPIIVARKPFKGSLVDNVIKNGVGGLNIDECRVENTNADTYDLEKRKISKATGSYNDGRFLDHLRNQDSKHGVTEQGRFPANVILTYDETDFEEVCGGMPDTKSKESLPNNEKSTTNSDIFNANKWIHKSGYHYEDNGSASRYFYCAKASKKDRDEGLELFNDLVITDGRTKSIDNAFNRGETLRKNIHPTVKPIELMQYLVRLVTPKNATILDCFMGSGSTGKAVMFENRERNANYHFIGVEMTEEYLPICKARIDYALNKYEYDFQKQLQEEKDKGQLSIFDFMEN